MMVDTILSIDGKPSRTVRRLEDGSVVSDASVTEMHEAHRETVDEQVTLGRLADEIGYDYVSVPELHFALQGTLSPNPTLTQTAIAQATEDVELLPSVVPDWHDPVRLAEKLAMLDVISDGRANVALTSGYSTKRGKLFNQHFGQYCGDVPMDAPEQMRLFEEHFEVILRAWTENLLSFEGEFRSIPTGSLTKDGSRTGYVRRYLDSVSEHEPGEYFTECDDGSERRRAMMVAPQPKQDPHPPLWTVISTERSARRAARRGMNGIALTRSFGRLRDLVGVYHESAEEADWPDRKRNGTAFGRGWDASRERGVAATVSVFNTDLADEETIARWKEGMEFVVYNVERARSDDPERIGPVDLEAAIDEWDSPIFGSTEEIVSELRRLRETCGYDDLLLSVSFDVHGLSTEEKRAQMVSFVEDVAPRL